VRFSNFDLHCHSFVSDGTLSPRDVVLRAAEKGVEHLSLTDHDTVAGLPEALSTAEEAGIRLISGIELSCQWSKYGVHILGYNFPFESPVMQRVQAHQTEVRLARAEEIEKRLMKKGLPAILEHATALSESSIPGRPHFAQAMMELGLVSSMGDAFKLYLGSGKVGDVKSGWPDLATTLDWIVSAGGTAVIAHPRKYDFSLTKLRELIQDFKEFGGEGMEVVVSGQKPGEVGMLADLCRRFELLGSVGSDFHSPKYAWAELGRVQALPDSVRPVWESWS
jgi:predicted metal-dependent phosphoesterase TrpH